MSPKCYPAPKRGHDPAGLDELLLAVGKTAHDFVQAKASRLGLRVDWWGGKDGLESVLREAITEHRIPNKKFQELVTPRSIINAARGPKRKLAAKRKAVR